MSFESWSAFIHMGGHGPFVWSAYAITLVVLAYNVVQALRLNRLAIRKEKLAIRREREQEKKRETEQETRSVTETL